MNFIHENQSFVVVLIEIEKKSNRPISIFPKKPY